MALIDRILLATDFSPGAQRACEYASQLAVRWKAELDLVYVLEVLPGVYPEFAWNNEGLRRLRTETQRALDEWADKAGAEGLSVTSLLREGLPSEQINEAAKERRSSLVILGTRGQSGLDHVLLGSTAERVVKRAPCPVLTVQGPIGNQTPRHILTPIDFSDCSLEAFEYMAAFAQHLQAHVTLLHVMEWATVGLDSSVADLGEPRKVHDQFEKQLAEKAEVLKARGIHAHYRLRGGNPADAILDVAQSERCDLVIMGTHGRRGFSRLLAGSVAEAVLRRAQYPVLTVKSPKLSPEVRSSPADTDEPFEPRTER